MCLGIPGRVTERLREHDVLMGKVAFGGITKRANLGLRIEIEDRVALIPASRQAAGRAR